MKTKALVLTFAVCAVCTGSLVAQQTPSQELAPIVAVEEQERDLAKAERLYKEAIDGGKLSAAAKEMATLRLAELLRKLGKLDEAKQWMGKLPMVAFDKFPFVIIIFRLWRIGIKWPRRRPNSFNMPLN